MTEKYGGSAFATGNPEQGGQGGMYLRDWFAGQALIGLGNWTPGSEPRNEAEVWERRAEWAYLQADAMLAEREKEPNK